MSAPRISIDQWTTLVSVVESGGYAKAAAHLHKSQSTLTYAIQQVERLLGVKLFEIQGRKAVLTQTGQLLYRRGKTLVDDAERLERAAGELAKGWETEVRLAVDIIFPTWLLVQCIGAFAAERPEARVELYETVLSGTDDMLLARSVDFVITSSMPQGFIGDVLMPVHALCVAAPSHPLHHLGRPATLDDLRKHRHLVIRDSGIQRARSGGWLNEQRWTVSHKATSIHALTLGHGYAWLPDEAIRGELERGALVPVPLREGAERAGSLYLAFVDRDATGPGALRLAEIIRETVASECKRSAIPT
ncbi:MAG TPA: LysR family transcriptional regulator [Burkholderiales bacterium]|jgi:DNA-binding transcriptional LysR family regulator|nr:LysR family transcriptional regulator [Burkholderiales bacterium]